MKKTFLLALLLTIVVGMQAQTGKKILVTYFSWSGGTKALAYEISNNGVRVASIDNAPSGIYIVNGQKTVINK